MITTVEVHKQNESIVTPNEVYPSAPSAVSWGAILAGAAGAAALSLILLILGSGLGFSVISPWANEGVSAKTFGISGILWLTLTSIAASGMGGYLAGRLRTRWTSVDRAEVYFRDTAHGFLAWGVATLLTAGVFTSTIALVVGGGVKAGAEAAKGQFNLDGDSTGYFIDLLFRPSNATSPSTSTSTTNEDLNAASSTAAISSSETLEDGTIIEQHPTQPSTSDTGITSPVTFGEVPTAEVARIFINALRAGSLPEGDAHYLGQIVSEHTSLPQPEAKDRVKAIYNQWQSKLQEVEKTVKEAADEARKTTAYISLWFFIALLIGAFTASWLATYGGAQRDL
jgi:hypothetical protein